MAFIKSKFHIKTFGFRFSQVLKKNLIAIEVLDFLGLGQTFWAEIFEGFGVFLDGLSAPILVLWVPCPFLSLLKHYFYKKPSLYKGGLFSESAIHFSNLPISKEKIFQKTILNLKFKFPTNNSEVLLAGNFNFKLRIDFWNIFFLEIWRFEKWIALSE